MTDIIHVTGDTVEGAVLLPANMDWVTVNGDNVPSKLISNGAPILTGFEPGVAELKTLAGKTMTLESMGRERFYDVGIALTVSPVMYSVTIPELMTKNVIMRSFEITVDNDIDVLIDAWSMGNDRNKVWKVEATGQRMIIFQIGDMLSDTDYYMKVNSAMVSDAVSDVSGIIVFPVYTGEFSEKEFATAVSPNGRVNGISSHGATINTIPVHESVIHTSPIHEQPMVTVPTHETLIKTNPTHK